MVSACGTGKTVTAVHTPQQITPHGRVLVLVPTLELLTQTVVAWRREGRAGAAVAVCSLESDATLAAADVWATSSVPQLVLWGAGKRQLVVFATYSSLPVLAQAHEPAIRELYGLEPLARWDLVVVDEAHRTSGSLGKAWADVHHQAVIPTTHSHRLATGGRCRAFTRRRPR